MQWKIDRTHSSVEFGVRHLGISTVRGRFQQFEGSIETDLTGRPTAIEVVIDANSLDTNVVDRDTHLRSADFFDVARFPTITYRSERIAPTRDGKLEITGALTLHGETKPVTFTAEIEAPVTDPWGNRRIAGVASGKLNRKDFGLHWNQVLEAGGLLVGEEVKFTLEVEVVEEVAAVAAVA